MSAMQKSESKLLEYRVGLSSLSLLCASLVKPCSRRRLSISRARGTYNNTENVGQLEFASFTPSKDSERSEAESPRPKIDLE
jgi:hypothetical protein